MRPRVHALVVVALALGAGAASACVQSQRALGEDCLKDQDCLSGICSELQCAAAPPVLDATAPAVAPDTGAPDTFVAPPPDTGAPDVPVAMEAAADSAPPAPDSSSDTGGDSATDATSD
jgi:hypothetical protein